MSEHTKGPITVMQCLEPESDAYGNCGIFDGNGVMIGEAFTKASIRSFADALANATLWAAAPDFMAACVSGPDPDQNHVAAVTTLINHFENWYHSDDDVDPGATFELLAEVRAMCKGLNAAIAKARGTQQATEAGR